jgi:hypothetical protein
MSKECKPISGLSFIEPGLLAAEPGTREQLHSIGVMVVEARNLRPNTLGGEEYPGWYVRHNGVAKPIVEILGKKPHYEDYFDSNGQFIYSLFEQDRLDLHDSSPVELLAKLETRLSPFYELVDISLDEAYPYGFNRHGIEHVSEVTRRALSLVKMAGGSDEDQRLVVLQGMLHDSGNMVTRKGHPVIFDFIPTLIPELIADKTLYAKVRKGIALHDERIASIVMMQCRGRTGAKGEDYFQKVRETFGLTALALLAADKSHAVDQERVTRKQCGPETTCGRLVDQDLHYAVSALVQTNGFAIEDQALVHNIDFTPGQVVDRKLGDVILVSKTGDKQDRVKVPDGFHRHHRDNGLPHIMTWLEMYASLHGKRLVTETTALLSLFPKLDSFIVRVEDSSDFPDKEGGLSLELKLNRELLQSGGVERKLARLAFQDNGDVPSPGVLRYQPSVLLGKVALRFSRLHADLQNLGKEVIPEEGKESDLMQIMMDFSD